MWGNSNAVPSAYALKMSKEATVAMLLPQTSKDQISFDRVAQFSSASAATRFEVMRVLRRRSQDPGSFFASIAIIVALLTLIITAYVGGEQSAPTFWTLIAFAVFCAIGTIIAGRQWAESRNISEWKAAFEDAQLQLPSNTDESGTRTSVRFILGGAALVDYERHD